jgi:hypothetical protein
VADDDKPTQKTTPKGKDKTGKPHEPIEIPVPKRKDIESLLQKAAKRGNSAD